MIICESRHILRHYCRTKRLDGWLTPQLVRHFASALDIPVPRLDPPESTSSTIYRPLPGMQYYIRVAPWGPQVPQPLTGEEPRAMLTQLEMTAADVVPNTNTKGKNKEFDVSADHFQLISESLKRYNVPSYEVEKNPGLFSMIPTDLEDSLEIYKELGWETMTGDMLTFHSMVLTRKSAKDVVNSSNYSVTRSILRNLLRELKINEAQHQEVLDVVNEDTASYLTLHECRILAFRKFLQSIFHTPADIQSMFKTIFRPSGPHRSLKSLQGTFEHLINDFKIAPKQVVKYRTLLMKHDKHFKDLLQNSPKFHGTDLRVIASSYPLVVHPSSKRIKETERILVRFGITQSQVARVLMVTTVSVETLERRLLALQRDPELWRYREDPDFLRIVVFYPDAMRRVTFLRSMNVRDFGVQILVCPRARFHVALNRGAYTGLQQRVRPAQLVSVAEWLEMPVTEVRRHIREQLKFRPFYEATNTTDMQKVIDAMKINNITKEQFLQCLSIALYPSHVVEKYLAEVVSDPTNEERRTRPNFLHYVLYAIEKASNFGGPQAWAFSIQDNLEEDVPVDDTARLMGMRNTLNENILKRLRSENGETDDQRDVVKSEDEWFKA